MVITNPETLYKSELIIDEILILLLKPKLKFDKHKKKGMAIMNSTREKSLSNEIIKQINEQTIKDKDKYLRVNDGIYTTLTRFEKGIVHMEIHNTRKTYPSCYDTAMEITGNWISWNEELKDAIGFFVTFYKVTSDGFLFNFTEKGENLVINEILEEYFVDDKKEFDTIYSGMISEYKHEFQLQDYRYNHKKDRISSETESQIVEILANNFESYNYQKEVVNVIGESEPSITAHVESNDILRVLCVITQIIRKYDFNFIKWKRNGKGIDITDNFICCFGATMIVSKNSINEKYEGATDDFIKEFRFSETSKYIYFTGNPLCAPVMDGLAYKYLGTKVMMNMSKYFECNNWSYYGGDFDFPDWMEASHDFGNGKFVIW